MTQPIVTVYCDGADVQNPHPRHDIGDVRQSVDDPVRDDMAHYWWPIGDWPTGSGAERLSGPTATDGAVRVRWRFRCVACPYDLILNRNGKFGAKTGVNGVFDFLAESDKTEISLRFLEHLTR